jgi:hypothetical protein
MSSDKVASEQANTGVDRRDVLMGGGAALAGTLAASALDMVAATAR